MLNSGWTAPTFALLIRCDAATEFDLTRENKSHMAFGHGVHHCLGAPLARLEANIALPQLFHHFPERRLAVPVDELPALPSFIYNGHASLPVQLTADR
ncbi:cytochrome P450 [Nocardia sp. CA-151230]|uniref:cytochrome P450 n=1 Tax=Nocardia sp. CA-151230 TaxID=3239982 RepID=UPI003D906109